MANQATITANKELVREFIDRVFNERNAKATQDYFSPDVQWHGGNPGNDRGIRCHDRLLRGLVHGVAGPYTPPR